MVVKVSPSSDDKAPSANLQQPTCAPNYCSPQPKFFGDGSDGPLVVDEQETIKVNHYAFVKGTAKESTKALVVSSTKGIQVGREICIMQMKGDNVGQSMFARVTAINTLKSTLSIDVPVLFRCSSEGMDRCQVVTVPHYTNVTLKQAAQIRGGPWNGRTGGVIVFRASEQVGRYNTLKCPH